jgi:SAM-dependent methyltransferase
MKKSSEEYWKSLAERITDPVQTKNKRPDTSDLEIEFLREYLKSEDDVLDIGSGSGLIINKLLPYVRRITAVEKFEGFTKFIVEDPKMLVINADLIGFKMRKSFDAALCFGVSQCFDKEDMTAIYRNIFDMLKPGGTFIVRMQCGLEKSKRVDGYSEELKTDYFADYRHWKEEQDLLTDIGFVDHERFDIFPDTLNVWPDSRHFIFICKKPA